VIHILFYPCHLLSFLSCQTATHFCSPDFHPSYPGSCQQMTGEISLQTSNDMEKNQASLHLQTFPSVLCPWNSVSCQPPTGNDQQKPNKLSLPRSEYLDQHRSTQPLEPPGLSPCDHLQCEQARHAGAAPETGKCCSLWFVTCLKLSCR